ncbi:MAG TPA: DUF998 domain-containing protein [Desulfurivibrionaceae bacterium]|nr:DUF998 domain-containing protein [Desulfurivibrionaceae bacterium]
MRLLLLLCGVASPLLYALADALGGLRWAGYSFRDQTISELGAIGAPSRPLFAALLVVVYLLFTAFGVGIWKSAQGRRRLRLAGGLLIGLGVLALTVGQFAAMQLRGTEQGISGALHLIEGAAAMILLLAAMGFAGAALGRGFALYTIATVAVMLSFGGWSAMEIPLVEAGLPTPWVGVKERIYWYSYQLWYIVLSIKLLRETDGARETSRASTMAARVSARHLPRCP